MSPRLYLSLLLLISAACSDNKPQKVQQTEQQHIFSELKKAQTQADSVENLLKQDQQNLQQQIERQLQ